MDSILSLPLGWLKVESRFDEDLVRGCPQHPPIVDQHQIKRIELQLSAHEFCSYGACRAGHHYVLALKNVSVLTLILRQTPTRVFLRTHVDVLIS